MLAINLRFFRRSSVRVHLLCFGVVLLGAFAFLLGAQGGVAQALGRDSTLSGRKEIWAAVIPAAPNAMIGAGFESFWDSPAAENFQRRMVGWWHPENLNEAHNGYIEIYLNLGWLGICLITTILATGYLRAVRTLRLDAHTGGLFLAYVVVSAVYSVTEAGFRMLNPMWFFFLLGIVGASGINGGYFGEIVRRTQTSRPDKGQKTLVTNRPGSTQPDYVSREVMSPFRHARANNPR